MKKIFLLLFCMFIMIIIGCNDPSTTGGETTTTIDDTVISTTTTNSTIVNTTTTNPSLTTTTTNSTTTTINITTTTTIIYETEFATVAAGYFHNLAIDWQGKLWAWGNNHYGQLGNGTTTDKTTPQKIKEGTLFKEVAVGDAHSLAIDSTGQLWAWGNNVCGQLGNGTTTGDNPNPTPQKIKEGTLFKAVAAGSTHNLAIDSTGQLWAWGMNYYGQLGNGTTTDWETTNPTPQKIKEGTLFKEVAAAYSTHSLVIDSTGQLWTWGDNYDGRQLGDGTTTKWEIANPTPQKIKEGTSFKAVATSKDHSLAIDEVGGLWAWGDNFFGQLGDGTRTDKNTPQKIKEGTLFKTVAAGYGHSLAIDSTGQLWAWGDNYYGQLGNGATTDRETTNSTPQKIKEGTLFKEVAAGYEYSLAIDSTGQLWAWGRNNLGQLGDGTRTDKNTPQKIKVFKNSRSR